MKRPFFCVLACVCLLTFAQDGVVRGEDRDARKSRTITAPQFDPDAQQVELFDGLENGKFTAQVIAKGPEQGFVLLTNTTDQALTVELPDTFVAVPVLKQFQPQPNGGLFNGLNNGNGNQPGGATGQAGQQPIGGGFPNNNGNNGNNGNLFGNGANGPGNAIGNGPGNGFFSIPPERTIRLSYVSACLAHGRPDPTPRSSYQLMRTSQYTQDPVLQHLIAEVAASRSLSKSLQAAVWHRTDDISWKDLAAKVSYTVLGKVPYFSSQQLDEAREFIDEARDLSDRQVTEPVVSRSK